MLAIVPALGARTHRAIQDVRVGVVIARYASHFSNVQGAISPGNSVGSIEAGQNRSHPVRFPVPNIVYESIDLNEKKD